MYYKDDCKPSEGLAITAEEMDSRSAQALYTPQLDSLRALAVFFVLIEHWFDKIEWTRHMGFGMIGVTLFFVLSGYLITGILLRSRYSIELKSVGRFHVLKQFYIRRALRIFPALFITIIVLFILNVQNIRANIAWFATFTSNVYMYAISDWPGYLSHFWTLAVEEQFYIFWPVVILFCPAKHILKSILLTIILGPAFRFILYAVREFDSDAVAFIHILTPACMDCFGIGALFAYLSQTEKKNKFLQNRYLIVFFILNILLLLTMRLFSDNSSLTTFLYRFCVSSACMIVIYVASNNFGGVAGQILDNIILRYMGKISYGMYLLHNFIPLSFGSLGISLTESPSVNFFIYFASLILLSTILWFIIEAPINNLKRYFRYDQRFYSSTAVARC